MAFLVRVLINGVAIWLATLILPGLSIVGGDSNWETLAIILLIALVFGLVNAIVKPIVAFISIPLYILTLGLFTIIVNALMLMLTAWITEFWSWGLRVESFWWGVVAALLITVINWIFSIILRPKRRD